jgi:hypothetical protein
VTEVESIKQDIEATKAALASKIDALETQARDLVSPVHYVEEYPLLSMGVALGAGLVVGSQIKDAKKLLQPVAMGIFSLLVGELEKKYLLPTGTDETLPS